MFWGWLGSGGYAYTVISDGDGILLTRQESSVSSVSSGPYVGPNVQVKSLVCPSRAALGLVVEAGQGDQSQWESLFPYYRAAPLVRVRELSLSL